MGEIGRWSEYESMMKNSGEFSKLILTQFKEDLHLNLSRSEKINIWKNHSIVFDIHMNSSGNGGDFSITLDVKDGLTHGLEIKNYGIFLFFCKVHGFYPIINDCYVNGKNISKIKQYSYLLSFLKEYLMKGDLISFTVLSEVYKIHDNISCDDLEVNVLLSLIFLFGQVRDCIFKDSVLTYGKGLQRKKGLNSNYENIFIESGIRLENYLRDNLGFFSTYLYPSSYNDDRFNKVDIEWAYKKYENDDYKKLPIQLVLIHESESFIDLMEAKDVRGKQLEKKMDDVERFLITSGYCQPCSNRKKYKLKAPFILFGLSGNFIPQLGGGAKSFEGKTLVEGYDEWLNDRSKRNDIKDKTKMPLFMDKLDKESVTSINVLNIVLHLSESIISKGHRFGDEKTGFHGTRNSIKGEFNRNLRKYKTLVIGGIKVSNINLLVVEVKNVSKYIRGHQRKKFHKIILHLEYDNPDSGVVEDCGTIVIYK